MADTSTFNPELFESQTVEHAHDTEWTKVPPGEYVAFIKDYNIRQFDPKDGSDMVYYMDVIYTVPDERLQEELQLDEVTIRGSTRLDLGPNLEILSGRNKNVGLGQIRNAVNQNKSGEPWSPRMLRGAGPVKITIEPDQRNPQFNRVTSVVQHMG